MWPASPTRRSPKLRIPATCRCIQMRCAALESEGAKWMDEWGAAKGFFHRKNAADGWGREDTCEYQRHAQSQIGTL